jgi:2-haloacid dehalogenase
MSELRLDDYDVLTFDCYGTIVDWDAGILAALRPILDAHGARLDDRAALDAYARHEAAVEAGPFRRYRDVLAQALRDVAAELHIAPDDAQVAAFAGSVGAWPLFDDSADALTRLAARYRLGVITNCDDDLFAATQAKLPITFDWVFTAQQIGSYKPDAANFAYAFERIDVPRERILHVAQSLHHDHVTARAIDLPSVWVDRRAQGPQAARAVGAAPDLVVGDLATLARRAGL